MKKSANSNMYGASLDETWKRFGARLDGAYESPVLVVSSVPLPDAARSALANSAKALGYGSGACTFLVLGANAGGNGDRTSDADTREGTETRNGALGKSDAGAACGPLSDAGAVYEILAEEDAARDPLNDAGAARGPLSDADAFSVVEGLDPFALVIADAAAADACSRAYRAPIATPDKSRLLGRDVVAFADFAAMLETPQEKQRAWGLLKRLPKLDS